MRGVMASPALAKAQAAGLAELRDALMSHWPRAGSTSPSPATLITSFLGERGCHPSPAQSPPSELPAGPPCSLRSERACPPFSSPPWDAVLGTGDLAGSCLYFWL